MTIGRGAQWLVLATALALGSARICDAVTLLGAAHQGSSGASTLYAIDSDDGSASAIGPIGFLAVSGMDFDAGGTLYATGFRPGDGTHVLITIDPATGAGTEVGPTGIENLGAFNAADVSFRPSDGTLYAYLEPFDDVGTIDTTTGAATLIGPSGGTGCCGNGIAFVGPTLYQANEAVLATLDQATGEQTVQVYLAYGPPADDGPRVAGMDASSGGTLAAVVKDGSAPGDSYLAVVGEASGNVRLIGLTQVGMDAFAIPPGVTFDVDADPPTCTLGADDLTGAHVELTVQDVESGLASIAVLLATNADCVVSPFTPGTTDPVLVACDAVTPHQAAIVQVQATDVDGNVHDCDETTFNVESTPPLCFAPTTLLGPPAQIELSALDEGSGLALVTTPIASNVMTSAPFSIGTTDTVTLAATPADPSLTSSVQFQVWDQDGNSTVCPLATFQRFTLAKNGTLRTVFTDLTHTQPVLMVKNGTPGFTRLRIAIGRFRLSQALTDGQLASFNLASGLSPGSNTVEIQAWGKSGSSMGLFAFATFVP